jgi:mannitol/fructose-specific phosphotransferase system IIA component (Ntr-type)/uncharacterized coiled-coil protein SlyX
MDTLLAALQGGRLIELPDNDKNHALQFLSHILEAIPSIPNKTDVSGFVLKREDSFNTSLGKGFAIPHARVSFEGDLLCAVGWSPAGINYNAPDNSPVHIVIMYFIPVNQRNQYLKEISNIAKALLEIHDESKLKSLQDLNSVRNYLLDMISTAKNVVGPEARSRMISLEIRETTPAPVIPQLSNILVESLTIIKVLNQKQIILTQNKELLDLLDNNLQITEAIELHGIFEVNGWRIVKQRSSDFQAGRVLIECVAVKLLVDSNQDGDA